VKHGGLLLIPGGAETRGHGTTGMAKFWKQRFAAFLATVPRR
jgi:homoserine O-acetyltransferase